MVRGASPAPSRSSGTCTTRACRDSATLNVTASVGCSRTESHGRATLTTAIGERRAIIGALGLEMHSSIRLVNHANASVDNGSLRHAAAIHVADPLTPAACEASCRVSPDKIRLRSARIACPTTLITTSRAAGTRARSRPTLFSASHVPALPFATGPYDAVRHERQSRLRVRAGGCDTRPHRSIRRARFTAGRDC